MDRLQELDTQLFLFFNGLNHQFVDPFMAAFSGRWIWVPLYVALAAVVVWRYGWKRGFVIIAMIGIAVGAADYISASIIRPVIQRMRPANLDNPLSDLVHVVSGYRGGRYGFPSCHAANTVAVALFLSMVFRYCRMIVLTLAVWVLLNCYSRMYLGVHYPGDIVAGALVGLLAGLIAYRVTFAAVSFIMHKKPEPLSGCEIRVKCGEGVSVVPDSALFMLTGLFTVVVLFAVSVAGYYC